MSNQVNANQPKVKRKDLLNDFKKAHQEAQNPQNAYEKEYVDLVGQVYRLATMVRKAPIDTKDKEKIREIKDAQILFLTDLKKLEETLHLDTAKKESEEKLEFEHVDQIYRRMNRVAESYGMTNLFTNPEVDELYKKIIHKVGEIYARVEESHRKRTLQKNNELVQESSSKQLNDLVSENTRHLDYPGLSSLRTLVSLPWEKLPSNKEEIENYTRRMSAQADMGNSANRLAGLICPLHAVDPETGTTKNLSHEDLTKLKAAYDDLLNKLEIYRGLLPENHAYQEQLATAAAVLVKERTQVERAIKAIEDNVKNNEELRKNVKPFSIYEVEGRINPEFNHEFFKKAQAVKRTGEAFRTRITQWKQTQDTKEMLRDYDDMMAAFNKLTNETIPQLMSLDRGDKGYLPAMTPQEVAQLRDDYRDAVIKIDQFARLYGKKPRSQEQKDFQEALAGLYFDMVDKFRMLDQLAGGEDVKDLPEALDILNERREELAEKQEPVKEQEKKEQEEAEQELSEEEQRLKDAGYYQMLLNDGQLFPQMLFEPVESQRSVDLLGLRRESQVLQGARKDFNQIMTRNRRMRACPDIATLDAALAVNPEDPELPEDLKEGFGNHFNALKEQIKQLAGKMTVYYEPDENGRTKLLNSEEIAEFEQAYRGLATEAFMCSGWLPKNDPRKAAFDELETLCDNHVKTLRAAVDYIKENAPEYREVRQRDEKGQEIQVIPRTRAFSLYELQGGINPEVDGGALDTVAQFKEEMDAFEAGLNKVNNKDFSRFEPIRAEYRTFAREIDHLYNQVIPDMLRMDPNRGGFADPVTRDKVQEYLGEFEKATMAFIPMRVDYERRLKTKKPPITEEEQKMFATAQKIYQRVSEKWLAMNYLLDRRGEEIMQDVERHNDQLAEFKEELKKYRENEQLPPQQRNKDLKLKHDAKFLAWAMKLDDLYMNKRLTPAALFEDDPSVGRSQILSELRLTEQNIIDVQMRAFYLGGQQWNANGTRDLGPVKEFQASLAQRNEFGTHTVMQYATKGSTQAKDIVEKAIRNIPEKLKGLQINYVEKLEPADPERKFAGPLFKEVTKKMTVEEAIRTYFEKMAGNGLVNKDEDLILDITNEDYRSYERTGFANAFSKEDLENNRPLMYFVCDLNRALLNAGCCTQLFDLHTDSKVPDGYNRGYSKVAAQALIDDLALVKSPEKGKVVFQERSDGHGNKPASNLLPETRLWEQTKFQFGEAKPDQTFDVVIASTEKNYAEQIPGDKTKEFYTTTQNFRSSSFVGYVPTSVTEIPDYSKMTAKELAQAEENINEFFQQQALGEKKASDPYTSEVEDVFSYQKADVLANAADLQVMGYLLGKPKYTADQLRIGFKLDEKGRPQVSNVLGAENDDDLFSSLEPNDPSLVDPGQMLVMTKDMAQKILDWSEGRFDPNERAVKEALGRLPQAAREAFGKRLQVMAAKVREAQAYQNTFDDVVDEGVKPGEPGLIGLQTKPGIIRILDRKDFNQLKVDDLAIGRNSGDYRTRETKPPVNIFDAVADLPKQSHLALMDKWAATWSGAKSKEYGELPESNYGKNSYRKYVHEGKFERRFTENERHRSLMKMKRMVGDIVRMDRDRKKESFFHWDTGKYKDVLKAQEELDKALSLYDLDRTIKSSQAAKELIAEQRKAREYNANYQKLWEETRKKNLAIMEEQAKVTEFNLKEKDKRKHKPMPALLPYPKRMRVPGESLDTTRSINDYRDLKPVKDAMLKLRQKLEVYLRARINPSSEFGKMRYAAMLKMYNDINDRLADYITYTGDTRVLPSVVKFTEIPSKDGAPVPEDQKKYKISFEPMMEPGEWELRIPDHVREDYIHTVRKEILDKANAKNGNMSKARSEANFAEASIRRRYEGAKQRYDLNGRRKEASELADFEILDDNDAVIRGAKEAAPRRLRPVLLKDRKKKKEAPKISPEELQRQRKAEYERLLKGGKQQGGFDFGTMSRVRPEPAPKPQEAPQGQKIIGNPPKAEKIIVNPSQGPKPKVNDMTFEQIMQKELGKENENNNIINNKENENNNIINNKVSENNIINNQENDNKIVNPKENDNKIVNPKENENNKIVINKEPEKKDIKVSDTSFNEIFKDLVDNETEKKEFHRPTGSTSTEVDKTKTNIPGMGNGKK